MAFALGRRGKRVFIGIVIAEWVGVAAFALFAWRVYLDRSSVLGSSTTAVVPIRRDRVIFQPDSQLKYYYELQPGISTDSASEVWGRPPVTYTVNGDGLRATREYTAGPHPGIYRIAAIGDSNTYGQWVGDGNIWPAILERNLNKRKPCGESVKFEVLNFGVPGYDISYTVRHFIDRGTKYDPDMLIWLIKDDDFVDMNEVMKAWSNPLYATISAERLRDIMNGNMEGEPEHIALEQYRKKYSETQTYEQQTVMMRELFSKYRGPLLFTTYMNATQPQYAARLKLWMAERPRTFFLDTLPALDTKEDRLPDGHRNEYGHSLIAQALYEYVVDAPYICPKP